MVSSQKFKAIANHTSLRFNFFLWRFTENSLAGVQKYVISPLFYHFLVSELDFIKDDSFS